MQQDSGSHPPFVGSIDSLLEAIQHAGIARDLDQRPVDQRAGPTSTHLEDDFPVALSVREMQVLALTAEGKSSQETSTELYLALKTV